MLKVLADYWKCYQENSVLCVAEAFENWQSVAELRIVTKMAV